MLIDMCFVKELPEFWFKNSLSVERINQQALKKSLLLLKLLGFARMDTKINVFNRYVKEKG